MHLSRVNNFHKESCCLEQVYHLKIMSNLYENFNFRSSVKKNKPVHYTCNRQDIHHSIKILEQKVINICCYCQSCYNCMKFHTYLNKLIKKGFLYI